MVGNAEVSKGDSANERVGLNSEELPVNFGRGGVVRVLLNRDEGTGMSFDQVDVLVGAVVLDFLMALVKDASPSAIEWLNGHAVESPA